MLACVMLTVDDAEAATVGEQRGRRIGGLAWIADQFSNSLNVHTIPPGGTLARFGSPTRAT